MSDRDATDECSADDNRSEKRIDRRHFIATTAAIGIGGIAGCSGSSDTTTAPEDDDTDAPTDEETPEDETTANETTEEDTPENETTEAQGPASGKLTIVHDTHVHGSYGDLEGNVNVATYYQLMNQIADQHEHVLKLGSGDDLASSVLSAQFDGKHITDTFNAGGLQYDTFGNHDFDMGPEVLRKRISDSEYQWLSANVRNTETGDVFGAEQGASRYKLVEAGDLTVGLTGMINLAAPTITSMGENTEVPGLEEPMRETVNDMREEGADLVVVMSHVAAPNTRELASKVDGIDAIVGDHAATFNEDAQVVNDTVLSFVEDEYEYVGELTLTVEDGELTGHELTPHKTKDAVKNDGIEPHPDVMEIAKDYEQQLSDQLGTVIGETTVKLDARESVVREEESNFGNYIADALRAEGGTDVAIQNGGGIRTDTLYPEGDITKRLVYSVLPFGNNLVTVEVSGETLREVLELGSMSGGGFLQISGMSYTYDPEKSRGNRVTEVQVGGEALDTEATYTMATNNFTATGGDGYNMLQDVPRIIDANEGQLLSVIVANAIREDGTISPEVEGRITTV